jgi:hypothetical protein
VELNLLIHAREVLKSQIQDELGVPCFDPENGASLIIDTKPKLPCKISSQAIQAAYNIDNTKLSINEDKNTNQDDSNCKTILSIL